MHIAFSQTAKVKGEGELTLGARWKLERFKAAQFVMEQKSELQVTGHFVIYTGCDIRLNSNAKLVLGSGYLNKNASINCYNHISIGHNVIIAENVVIRDSDNHHINGKMHSDPIIIDDDVWIGLNVTILNGVTIGKGAVIAAGSVVTKSIPPHCLAAGCPAKVKKEHITWH